MTDVTTWLNWTQLAGIGIVCTFVMTSWRHIQGFFGRLIQYVICEVEITGSAAPGLAVLLRKEAKPLQINVKTYFTWQDFIRADKKWSYVAAEEWRSGHTYMMYFRRSIIALTISKDNYDNIDNIKFRHLRGTIDVDALIIEANEMVEKIQTAVYSDCFASASRHCVMWCVGTHRRMNVDMMVNSNEKSTNGATTVTMTAGKPTRQSTFLRQYRYYVRLLQHTPEGLGEMKIHDDPLHALVIPQYLQPYLKEAEMWSKMRDFYIGHGLSYKRGWFLSGEPGTGKTAFIRAVAEYLDMPVFIMDLASMDNNELMSMWKTAVQHRPCFIVMEDIDSVFHGRENISGGHLSFDCLLNHLDGVQRADGIFTVLTSNHPDKIDMALINRPGRIDRHIVFQKLGREDCHKLAHKILQTDTDGIEYLMDLHFDPQLDGKQSFTAANFEKICLDYVLEKKWKEAEQLLFDKLTDSEEPQESSLESSLA